LVFQPVPTSVRAALVPNSRNGGTIRYRCFYLFNIKIKFNFNEIFVSALKTAIKLTIVKLVDNCYAQLYI
jgi:hypothetical protein